MRTWPLLFCLVALGLASLPACRHTTSNYSAKFVSDRPWPVGEARSCSFDGPYSEMHCFPPAALFAPKYNYLVTAEFDKPVQFDAHDWAFYITCRLDSFEHATCRKDEPGITKTT